MLPLIPALAGAEVPTPAPTRADARERSWAAQHEATIASRRKAASIVTAITEWAGSGWPGRNVLQVSGLPRRMRGDLLLDIEARESAVVLIRAIKDVLISARRITDVTFEDDRCSIQWNLKDEPVTVVLKRRACAPPVVTAAANRRKELALLREQVQQLGRLPDIRSEAQAERIAAVTLMRLEHNLWQGLASVAIPAPIARLCEQDPASRSAQWLWYTTVLLAQEDRTPLALDSVAPRPPAEAAKLGGLPLERRAWDTYARHNSGAEAALLRVALKITPF